MPFTSVELQTNLRARILDKQGRLVKRYEASSKDKYYIAIWWGYPTGLNTLRAFQLKTYRTALMKILKQIKSDMPYIKERLEYALH